MKALKLPAEFIRLCKSVTAKRPRTVIDHIFWSEGEVGDYERLKRRTLQLQKNIPGYVKEIIKTHLRSSGTP